MRVSTYFWLACAVVAAIAAGLVGGDYFFRQADEQVLAEIRAQAEAGVLARAEASLHEEEFVLEVAAAPALDFSQLLLEWRRAELESSLADTHGLVRELAKASGALKNSLAQEAARDAALQRELAELTRRVAENKNLPAETYEKILVARLGENIYSKSGPNSDIMIFKLENEGLRGYMAKIHLKTSDALKVTMAPDDKLRGETTSQAAIRLGGVFAVNGGGFAEGTVNGVSRRMPIGTTMIDGKILYDIFIPSAGDLAFIGLDKSNKLVGGFFDREEDLLATGAWQGVSFVPPLVKDWEPLKIPGKWANTKEPRTVMGQYNTGDIFFIVVDGRQSDWSNGITLEEMQVLLLRLGVKEAYNLDGGGSSAMYYNGSVLNRPSDGTERLLATNIVVMP